MEWTGSRELSMANRGAMTSWRDADEVDASALPGDKIEFHRGVYRHVGISDGRGGVFHFSGEPKQKAGAHFRHDKLNQVAGKDKVRINNKEDGRMKPLPRREIVKRAKKQVGKGHGTYNLTTNNCEHKATEMRYGKPESDQVNTWVAVGIAGIAAVGMYTVGKALFGGREDDDDSDSDSDED